LNDISYTIDQNNELSLNEISISEEEELDILDVFYNNVSLLNS